MERQILPEASAIRRTAAGALVRITVDGHAVDVRAGQMLAAALLAAGVLELRRSPRAKTPRGAFCFMGACQECAIHVDGRLQQACQVRVAEGMTVELRGAV